MLVMLSPARRSLARCAVLLLRNGLQHVDGGQELFSYPLLSFGGMLVVLMLIVEILLPTLALLTDDGVGRK